MVAPFGLSLSYEALCVIRTRLQRFFPVNAAKFAKYTVNFCIAASEYATIGRLPEVPLMPAQEQHEPPRSNNSLTNSAVPAGGQCSFCAADNPRESIACHFCGSRLPWTFERAGLNQLELKLHLERVYKNSLPIMGASLRPEETAPLQKQPVIEHGSNEPILITDDIVSTSIIKYRKGSV
jgi:hypothetical protein